jgi:hypothetical protein
MDSSLFLNVSSPTSVPHFWKASVVLRFEECKEKVTSFEFTKPLNPDKMVKDIFLVVKHKQILPPSRRLPGRLREGGPYSLLLGPLHRHSPAIAAAAGRRAVAAASPPSLPSLLSLPSLSLGPFSPSSPCVGPPTARVCRRPPAAWASICAALGRICTLDCRIYAPWAGLRPPRGKAMAVAGAASGSLALRSGAQVRGSGALWWFSGGLLLGALA